MAVMQIFDGCRRPSATIENLVPAHIMQISMVAENLLQPSNGYRRPSTTVKIRKQMRKLKQNTSVFLHTVSPSKITYFPLHVTGDFNKFSNLYN